MERSMYTFLKKWLVNLFFSRKKEKIQHCYVVTEAVSNPTIRVSTDFHRILGTTIETFLKLTDDPESDVRMTVEECLNRIIRVGVKLRFTSSTL